VQKVTPAIPRSSRLSRHLQNLQCLSNPASHIRWKSSPKVPVWTLLLSCSPTEESERNCIVWVPQQPGPLVKLFPSVLQQTPSRSGFVMSSSSSWGSSFPTLCLSNEWLQWIESCNRQKELRSVCFGFSSLGYMPAARGRCYRSFRVGEGNKNAPEGGSRGKGLLWGSR
jgi:hypothetical protein